MDPLRRRMVEGLVLLILCLPILTSVSLAYHRTTQYEVAMVVVNAAVFLLIGGLIVRTWLRRGIFALGVLGLALQVVLVLSFTLFLGLAISRLV